MSQSSGLWALCGPLLCLSLVSFLSHVLPLEEGDLDVLCLHWDSDLAWMDSRQLDVHLHSHSPDALVELALETRLSEREAEERLGVEMHRALEIAQCKTFLLLEQLNFLLLLSN